MTACHGANEPWLFTGSADRTIRQWNLSSGQAEHVLTGHQETVASLAVDDAGRRLVSGDYQGVARIWDIKSGQCLHELHGHTDSVIRIALDAQGTRAVTASVDHSARVWRVNDGSLEQQLQVHTDRLSGAAISKDGSQAVSASWDHTARVWDLTRSVEVWHPDGHASEVEDVVARGGVGVSGGRDGSVIFWNLASGKGRHGDLSHGDVVTGVAVSQDGRRAISAALNGGLYVWDVTG
jgi:WD40 repeat protein